MFLASVFISLETNDTGFLNMIEGVTSLLTAANAAEKEDLPRRAFSTQMRNLIQRLIIDYEGDFGSGSLFRPL